MSGADAIARGAAATFLGHAGKVSRPVALALFTRIYGLEALGTALLVWAYVEIVSRIAGLGLDRGLQRWVPAATPDERPRVVAAALVAALAVGAPVGVLVAAVLPYVLGVTDGEVWAVRISATLLLPLLTVATTALHAVRGTRQIGALIWGRSVVEPAGFLIAGLLLAPLGGGTASLLAAYVIAMVAVAVVATRALLRTFRGADLVAAVRSPDGLPIRRLIHFSAPLGVADAVNLGLQRGDVVAVGLVTGSPAQTAAYAVAREIVTSLSKVRQGFDQVLAPVAAELHAGERHHELATSVAMAARWSATVAAPIALVLAIYPDVVLRLFGVSLPAAATALTVLAVGRWVDVATGPTAVLLGMVGRPRRVLVAAAAGLALATLGQAVLTPALGLVGAAAATSSGLVAVNLLALYWLDRLEGLHPLSGLARPVALTAVAGAVLLGLRLAAFQSDAPLMPLAAIIATWALAYVAAAIALGLLPAAWNPFRRATAEVT
jgi:O-antigen/teichoic acid export membrane protein